jgi:hypothetical protein
MITQDEIKDKLNYDQNTGVFTWKVKPNSTTNIGKVAGTLNKNYVEICVSGKKYGAHRLAWLYVYGEFPKLIDHINNNPSDNRICNLREATHKQNSWNSKTPITNTSGIKGVSWHKRDNKWRVCILGKQLGLFADFFEACCKSFSARNSLHGEFANHGSK